MTQARTHQQRYTAQPYDGGVDGWRMLCARVQQKKKKQKKNKKKIVRVRACDCAAQLAP